MLINPLTSQSGFIRIAIARAMIEPNTKMIPATIIFAIIVCSKSYVVDKLSQILLVLVSVF